MKTFGDFLLPLDAVRLGRFVPDVRHPRQSFRDPPLDASAFASQSIQESLQEVFADARGSHYSVQGTAVAWGSFMRYRASPDSISTARSEAHTLSNSDAWFRAALRYVGMRDWIVEQLGTYGQMNVITGFHVVHDAQISEALVRQDERAVGVKVPVAAALTAIGAVPLLASSDLVDPAAETARLKSTQHVRTYVAPGQRVAAILYRRVKFKWYSSRDNLDAASLAKKENTWKIQGDAVRRGQHEDVNDIVEASLKDTDSPVEDDDDDDEYSDDEDDDDGADI